jgi:hypothetical protein
MSLQSRQPASHPTQEDTAKQFKESGFSVEFQSEWINQMDCRINQLPNCLDRQEIAKNTDIVFEFFLNEDTLRIPTEERKRMERDANFIASYKPYSLSEVDHVKNFLGFLVFDIEVAKQRYSIQSKM